MTEKAGGRRQRRKRMKMNISGGGAKRLRVAWDGGKVNPAMEMSHKGEKREEKGGRRREKEYEGERERLWVPTCQRGKGGTHARRRKCCEK